MTVDEVGRPPLPPRTGAWCDVRLAELGTAGVVEGVGGYPFSPSATSIAHDLVVRVAHVFSARAGFNPVQDDAHSQAHEAVRAVLDWTWAQYHEWLHGRWVPCDTAAFEAYVQLRLVAPL